MNKRLGRVKFSRIYVEENHELMVHVFFLMKFIPQIIEFNVIYNTFEYTGVSSLFEELEAGDLIQDYMVDVVTSHDTVHGVEVNKA